MKYFLILPIFLLALAGCGHKSVENTDNANPPADSINLEDGNHIIDVGPNIFSMEEIAKHDNPEDCWFVIDNKVYDVTGYEAKHPGGEAILVGCGKDATQLFETRPMGSGTPHSDKARSYMPNYYIGDLE
jgi:cytochrome b involved in lipid metabolism